MKKLLYITDVQEYTDHGTIGPLFHGYLKQHMDVNIVYFTKYKHSFQEKGSDYIVPEKFRKDVPAYLESKGIDILAFDFVFVRNMYDVLKVVLKSRSHYNYKVGFRVSVPRTTQVYELEQIENRAGILSELKRSFSNYKTSRLINQCDLFMPGSTKMKKSFYSDITIKTHPLRPGLDPARVQPYLHTSGDDITFIYIGTVDIIQRFEVILDAVSNLKATNWRLRISTFNPTFVRELLSKYPHISERIELTNAEGLDQLMEQIHDCDIGLALLPELSVYGCTVAAKVMDYYTCSMPAVMTDNERNRSLFDEGETGFFCHYEAAAITQKLDELMTLSLDDLAKIGEAGQKKLLSIERNYEVAAEKLYEALESL